MDSIIVLDSDDEVDVKPPEPKKQKLTATILPTPVRPICPVSPKVVAHPEPGARVKEVRRVTPMKIGEKTPVKDKIRHFGDDDEFSPISSPISRQEPSGSATVQEDDDDDEERAESEEDQPLNATYQELIDVCREAEDTPDMEMLIEKKLIRYYHSVHPDFVNSKSFCRTVRGVTEDIRANPGLVYLKISSILEELNTRRKSRDIVMVNEEATGTGSERRNAQIKRLSKALYILKKRIAKMEETEVDFDDDHHSVHIQVEQYKKRACQIYEKICDLTGESKTAQRAVRKPIRFQETDYPAFNRALQMFVNRTNVFPDSMDVYKCLEHCNKQFGFGLKKDELKKIAQDAFVKIGKLLQCRRKADLYETVMHFTGTRKDPALEDKDLEAKLEENKKHYSKINELIDSFAKRQESEAKGKTSELETSTPPPSAVGRMKRSSRSPSPGCSRQLLEGNEIKDRDEGAATSSGSIERSSSSPDVTHLVQDDSNESIILLDASDNPKNE
uniref:Daxx histone-binding domain-containing protein n=1 Tax=Lutzomyia longipalpis TaxID=7200 RepID=A0A1B0CVR2_LUTLO